MTATLDGAAALARRCLLADGKVVLVRELAPADAAEVAALHRRLGERDARLRFLGPVPSTLDTLAARISGEAAGSGHAAVGAYLAGALIGVAHHEALADPAVAEIALVVDARAQATGVGTLLLEHLVSLARGHGITRLLAVVSAENTRMLRVLRDFGLPMTVTGHGPEREVTLTLDGGEEYLDSLTARERVAEVASLRHVLEPASVAVIGASRRAGAVGNAVLRNLLDAGFAGPLRAVNPKADEVLGVPCAATVADLPECPELAVICVPAAAVPAAVEDCGRRGVRALVIVTAGLGEDGARAVRASIRRYGIRVVGPNCIGIANTDPAVRLNATFLRAPVPEGDIGLMTQSGGIAIALSELLGSVGLGLSTVVSAGDKYDISGNDLLLWWQEDERTAAAVLYLESFGNPRKFGRFARALARHKPVLAVRGASTALAQRAAASHTAAGATPAVSRDALFEQAGVIAVDTLTETLTVLAALRWQTLPRGNRVAIVSNAGGAGVLAVDACARHGLVLPELGPETTVRLRALLPGQASIANPVDTTAAVHPLAFGACVDAIADDPGIDAVVVAVTPTAVGDPTESLRQRVALRGKPVIVVRPGQLAPVEPLVSGPDGPGTASYADPETAAQVLGHLARYAAWLAEPAGSVPGLPGLDTARAREIVDAALAEPGGDGWLSPAATTELLRSFGLPMVEAGFARDESEAEELFARCGGPVAVKASAEGLLHKSAGGGVELGVADPVALRAVFGRFRERFGAALRGVVVQPMVPRGRELLVGISADEVFGPLVVFGLGGVDTDLIADRSARLAPLTEADAGRLLHGLRCSPELVPSLPEGAVRDVLLRVGQLAVRVPEIAELDLNPVVVTGGRCLIPDARVRVRRQAGADAHLRNLKH
ncbi:bifunctional GNAT family N-acetyltransferase/acetate--CoA ligase family protein [Prauserella muralis]|uniref:Acyl-CoA synthetase n=1 Tax=Prauserella muralis TaxID=588067 RepID=A0A2V4ANN3_9PSEU|nr:bifunctional GNAT family N-acetyltransferase/acetate--CoA ligase family protein [Prauserella muralis]PXY22313.1 acyl-CoA synthetase [Prauserella muralis]TWE27962.1 acyl-CoA synthetase (NDP forming) [Prauserella muralis]